MANGRKNRTKVDITYNILSTARNGALKTHLMREANLNTAQFSKMLDNMVRNGLISVKNNGSSAIYQTSSTGTQFIRRYEDLLKLMNQSVEEE